MNNLEQINYEIQMMEIRSNAVIKNLEGQKYFAKQKDAFINILKASKERGFLIFTKQEIEAKIKHYERCLERVRSWMPLAEQLYIVEYGDTRDIERILIIIRASNIADAWKKAEEISKDAFIEKHEDHYRWKYDEYYYWKKLLSDADFYCDYTAMKFSMEFFKNNCNDIHEEDDYYINPFMKITNQYTNDL